MGNLTTLAYLNDNLSSAARPEVAHLVFLAGGLSEEMTTDVAGHLTKRLPANLAVLNVYSTGDQRVPNSASKRLRPLFKGRAAR